MKPSRPAEETRQLAEYYADRMEGWRVSIRRLFGTLALYRDGHIFGVVWEGALYFKVDDASRPDYQAAGSRPMVFTSREGEAQPVKSYWEVPAEIIEDDEALMEWAERAWRISARSGRR